jgi:hypothetical protein
MRRGFFCLWVVRILLHAKNGGNMWIGFWITIFLLDGRIYNSKVFWLPSQKMMFHSLILQKTMGSRCKMKFKSMHWHTTLVNILVHITCRWLMPLVDDTIQDQDENLKGWVKELHFYIFDDTQHDSLFVQHYFML